MSQKNFAQMQSLILYERWQILTDWECVAEKKKEFENFILFFAGDFAYDLNVVSRLFIFLFYFMLTIT